MSRALIEPDRSERLAPTDGGRQRLAYQCHEPLLILRVATHDDFVPWLVGGVVIWYLVCWFVLPLWARRRTTE